MWNDSAAGLYLHVALLVFHVTYDIVLSLRLLVVGDLLTYDWFTLV